MVKHALCKSATGHIYAHREAESFMFVKRKREKKKERAKGLGS